MRLTFCLCHMVYKTTRKEYGILQTRHTDVCLDKADGVCRREVGTARLPAVTLPCLDCLIIHIHSYLYCYPYYFISILLHYHIDVLLYCSISTLSYICIALFMSIWIYRNINISILVLFPFASFLHARRCCVFRKHGETAQEQSFSSLQSSKGERSNILQWRCKQHPILRMLHTFRAAIRK